MKKENLEKEWKRYNQKLALLFENPEFKKDIHRIRKEYGLPPDGMPTDKQSEKFEYWLCEEQDKFYKNEFPKYRNELEQLRKSDDYLGYKNRLSEVNNYAPLNRLFKVHVVNLIKKYNLSPSLKNTLNSYIRHGNRCMKIGLGVIIQDTRDEYTGQGQIKIVIQEDTTLEELLKTIMTKTPSDIVSNKIFTGIKSADCKELTSNTI